MIMKNEHVYYTQCKQWTSSVCFDEIRSGVNLSKQQKQSESVWGGCSVKRGRVKVWRHCGLWLGFISLLVFSSLKHSLTFIFTFSNAKLSYFVTALNHKNRNRNNYWNLRMLNYSELVNILSRIVDAAGTLTWLKLSFKGMEREVSNWYRIMEWYYIKLVTCMILTVWSDVFIKHHSNARSMSIAVSVGKR